MLRDLSPQTFFMGLLVAFTGFASSFAVILAGLKAMGANEAQLASGLMATAISMGVCGIFMSLWTREPLSSAWTTPGAAFLATSAAIDGGFPVAVGAFIVTGCLLFLAGAIRPFGRLISSIPASLASAMLAGILFELCLAPFKAIAFSPLLGLPILLAWLVVGAFKKLLAVPAALIAFIAVVAFGIDLPDDTFSTLATQAMPTPVFTMPAFTLAGIIGIALPLFVITMASQNIPGIAVMKTYEYEMRPRLWFITTGLSSTLTAFFGAVSVNLAAITAAMCAGPEAHADKHRRYWSAVVAGVFYVIFGLLSGIVTAFVTLAPGILIQAVAGLALIGAFTTATVAAFKDETKREAAAITFLMTASGITMFGISGAFWGLIAGMLTLLMKRQLASSTT